MKKAEDGDEWILRFYETYGKECKTKINFPKPINKVERVSLLEEKVERLSSQGNEIEMPVGKNKIETIRIRL
ncbi:glycosyl hydrolase-related protein [candidate division NPL-UPA2 bacterium]|nr:glycosyl hydrolase-related protein [candidate division NPL-UPA2 bacterium]